MNYSDTFGTPFCLGENRRYVRYDWNSHSTSSSRFSHTFDLFISTTYGRSKWTSLDDKKYCSFDRVRTLICHTSVNKSFDIHSAYFPNIHELKISTSLPKKIWCVILSLDFIV